MLYAAINLDLSSCLIADLPRVLVRTQVWRASRERLPTPPNANYGARAAFFFSPFALVCLACFSFPALLCAVYSSLAVHAASRVCESPSGAALEVSLLSDLTTRFLHVRVHRLLTRQ